MVAVSRAGRNWCFVMIIGRSPRLGYRRHVLACSMPQSLPGHPSETNRTRQNRIWERGERNQMMGEIKH